MKVTLRSVAAPFLLVVVWVSVRSAFGISDRYLPSPLAVLLAVGNIEPSLVLHFAVSWLRLIIGVSAGVIGGIAVGLWWWRSPIALEWTLPSVQAIRAVPSTATVPFFILWFGFAEYGRLLILLLGVGLNVAVAVREILSHIPLRYATAMSSFGLDQRDMPVRQFALPFVLETLLPTVRYSLATGTALVVVSELLGAQVGLGHLIQTALSTFSLHLVFLSALCFGVISSVSDFAVVRMWKRIVYWRNS